MERTINVTTLSVALNITLYGYKKKQYCLGLQIDTKDLKTEQEKLESEKVH